MNAPHAQSLADADRDVRQWLIKIAAVLGDLFGDDLAGFYVRGSLATGAFHRARSNVNLLAVVASPLPPAHRQAAARTLVRLSDARPTWGDLDITVLRRATVATFVHPMPYEVRYASALHEAIRRGTFDYREDRIDADLAVQIAEVRERGIALVGPQPSSLFGPVPWHAYANALEADLHRARARLREMPVYAVLNAARIVQGLTGGGLGVPNKDEAARWALDNVPQAFRSVINDSLQLYRGTKSSQDVIFRESEIIAFLDYVRERCAGAFARAADTGDDES